jgi:energy-coupling factor transporter ATP-binding protein EcfA2
MKNDVLFDITNLEIKYGIDTVLTIDKLIIHRGERIALTGPNGAGKSTLLKCLNGLTPASAGRVDFMGKDSSDSLELRRRSVYMHQMPYIMTGSIAYNVGYGCRARKMPTKEIDLRVQAMLTMLGLAYFGKRRHVALSGGEAQRVALARVLAPQCDILLLDEPTANVDVESRLLVQKALLTTTSEGVTLIFSSHDKELNNAIANRRIEFDRGRIVSDIQV